MKILILKIIILIELLLFLGLFIFYPQYNCDNCKFEIDGKKISTEKLIDLYFGECVENHNIFYTQQELKLINGVFNDSDPRVID